MFSRWNNRFGVPVRWVKPINWGALPENVQLRIQNDNPYTYQSPVRDVKNSNLLPHYSQKPPKVQSPLIPYEALMEKQMLLALHKMRENMVKANQSKINTPIKALGFLQNRVYRNPFATNPLLFRRF